jgi:hypothetical protein
MSMNIHDCGGPLSRRFAKIDGFWELELRNTNGTDAIRNIHIVSVFFRDDGEDGKPNIQITFDDISLLAPQEVAIAKHTTHLCNENHSSKDDMWVVADDAADRFLLLSDESAKGPISLDAQFEVNGKNCYQELGAGRGSGLTLKNTT